MAGDGCQVRSGSQDGITSSKCEVSFRISVECPAELANKGKSQPLALFFVSVDILLKRAWISVPSLH